MSAPASTVKPPTYGNRRPLPHVQVREALTVAVREGRLFEWAWTRAVHGEVCDSYRSRRNDNGDPWPEVDAGEPDSLREAAPVEHHPTTGDRMPLEQRPPNSRCAGCRYLSHDLGRSSCELYGIDVYAGVLWPHQTDARNEWQIAIVDTEDDWGAAYNGEPTRYSRNHGILADAHERGEDLTGVEPGTVAA